MHNMNIVFFGEDAFSNVVLLSLIRAGYDIMGVVTPYYPNNRYKKISITCKKYGIDLLIAEKINSKNVIDFVKVREPDICVIAHFERLIRKDLLSIPKKGFINLHPSLLPNYRGLAPQHWPIINGDKETGVTVHFVDEGTDTGDIIVQEKIEISLDDYVSDLQTKWLKVYDHIVVDAIEKLNSSDFSGFSQRGLTGSYYGRLKDEDCVIQSHYSIDKTLRLIRGVSFPYQGARWKNYVIFRAHKPNELESRNVTSKQNGLYIEDGLVYLCLNHGILIIDKYILL